MKILTWLIAVSFLVAIPANSEDLPFVTLTDMKGRTIEAQILELNADATGWEVRKRDGTVVLVTSEMLSGESLSVIADEKRRQGTGAPVGAGVSVQALAVKKVEGKYRYFFRISNGMAEPFSGAVKIALQNAMVGVSNGNDTFTASTPMPPGGAALVYLDVNTGPRDVHADASVVGYVYTVTINGDTKAQGSGDIPERLSE